MALLAFDCCLSAVSVAVMTGDRVCLKQEHMAGGQAERLMPLIEDTLREAGVTFGQLERLAVTLGPGGFTSVRVGIAAARGFALALGIPVVGQSTLQALAEAAPALPPGIDRVIAVIPAGRGGLYWQAFAHAQAISAPRVVEAEALEHEIIGPSDAILGPGALTLAAGRATGFLAADLLPRADILARRAKHLTPDSELRPIYLRAADAKPQTGKALPRA